MAAYANIDDEKYKLYTFFKNHLDVAAEVVEIGVCCCKVGPARVVITLEGRFGVFCQHNPSMALRWELNNLFILHEPLKHITLKRELRQGLESWMDSVAFFKQDALPIPVVTRALQEEVDQQEEAEVVGKQKHAVVVSLGDHRLAPDHAVNLQSKAHALCHMGLQQARRNASAFMKGVAGAGARMGVYYVARRAVRDPDTAHQLYRAITENFLPPLFPYEADFTSGLIRSINYQNQLDNIQHQWDLPDCVTPSPFNNTIEFSPATGATARHARDREDMVRTRQAAADAEERARRERPGWSH